MLNRKSRTAVAGVALALVSVGCSENGASPGIAGPEVSSATQAAAAYTQVEFLGNPLVSEVTIMKVNHDLYNRTQPYNTATFQPQTEAFITSFGRPQSLATLLGSVLYPDILIVDTSKSTATAGWLSWALASGWGGRKLTDDVVDVGLSAIFSHLLVVEGHFCAPFQLPLCTDNVGANDKAFLGTFPYLAAPSV